jgi:hypothetical protein
LSIRPPRFDRHFGAPTRPGKCFSSQPKPLRQSASPYVFASERGSPFTPSGFAELLARAREEADWLLAVLFRVLPRGIVLVLSGFQVMTECNPRMMRGLFVIACFVMLGGLAMMFGSLVIVLRSLFVVLVNLVLCHSVLPDLHVSTRFIGDGRSKAR